MADVVAVVGVPLMTPVDGSKVSPVGSAGDTDQEVTVPVTVGVSGEAATLTGNERLADV